MDRGVHGTAVPAAAQRAGIAAGTIYHYFPGKEALVNALFRKWKTEVGRRVLTAFPGGAPVRDQFRVMWNEMVAFALAHPKAFNSLELHHHRSYLDPESQAMENNLKDFAAAMVQHAPSSLPAAGPGAGLPARPPALCPPEAALLRQWPGPPRVPRPGRGPRRSGPMMKAGSPIAAAVVVTSRWPQFPLGMFPPTWHGVASFGW